MCDFDLTHVGAGAIAPSLCHCTTCSNTPELRDCSVLHFTSNLAIVLGLFTVVVIIIVLISILFILAIILGHISIALSNTQSFAFTFPDQSVLLFFAISQHDDETLEFSVLLDRFEQLYKGLKPL